VFSNRFSVALFRCCLNGFDFFLGWLQRSFLSNPLWISSNWSVGNVLSLRLRELPFNLSGEKPSEQSNGWRNRLPGDVGVLSQRSLMKRSIDDRH